MVYAQTSGPENVIIDGKLTEWGPSLKHYDKAAVLEYDLHNDQDFLYIAFKRPKFAWNIALPKRMIFEISDGDKPGVQIVYPGHYSNNKDEMWNHLEIKKSGSNTFDTLTVYNDDGIQAAGGFWIKAVPAKEAGGAPDESETAYYVGADGELAIPRKLLPVKSGTCTIRISIPSEKEFANALNVLVLEAHFDPQKGSGYGLEALLKESKLSVTYLLK
ncbi:hypothetical protein DVR12_20030 [Chitinophaga silvatica]|uniref:Uncharacterized protein n=1 Tax=Chitinophaga silvatica TaxID=2282649 RepID=A0A3E1Y5K9_9BACT|nr:hypothetical protein DVR12_20030 [Chitinophaga silvatica]